MNGELPADASEYDWKFVVVNAVLAIGATGVILWWASGFSSAFSYGVFFERPFRVAPTVQGGGIGADWVSGNSITWLDFGIALTHAADVLMGIFILVMVFVHWASFRRLASRMRRPGEASPDEVAADGGRRGGDRE